jgi:hypothetical protein
MKKELLPDLSQLDMDGGFLNFSVHWRPNPKAPNPDKPGQKLSMLSYIPTKPDNPCLCSSGKIYSDCCQPKRYWHPICLNPDMDGYNLMTPQSATFRSVNGAALREQLMEDERLYCTDDRIESSFWTFWGDPAWEDQHGVLCFGDFEIKKNQILVVSAMSDLRMQILLEVLKELSEEPLGTPKPVYDQVELIDKWVYKPPPKDKRRLRF